MLITIFTPLYNRAHFLEQLYQSMLSQNNNDIEWIIVDDGSKDNAKEIIEALKHKSPFPIKYHYQNNKGKHFAINKGLELAKGELFLILDSDDYLSENAINIVTHFYKKVKDNPKIAGVAGRRNYNNGTIVGNQPFTEIISNSVDIRHKHKTKGDLVEIFKTEVLRKFKFPEIKNEKFCPEVLIWNRIAKHYNLLFFNKGIYTTQYLEGGLTDKIVKIRMNSPMASMLTYSELAASKIPINDKIKANINFWRFSLNSKKPFKEKLKMLQDNMALLLYPLGFLMYLKDKKQHL